MTPNELARELVETAKKVTARSRSCHRMTTGIDNVVNRKYAGWSFSMDCQVHPSKSGGALWHYNLSAKLFPVGRNSTGEDWKTLGKLLADITDATGYSKEAPLPDPVIPIESLHPNSTIHWAWHDDGSAVDAVWLSALAATLGYLQKTETEQAVARGLAVPGRNDPCSCGSGKKFKKCHGAAN